ncbi:MAG TPA: glycosyltransferase family 2 protein [Thermoanaerobaculia bacterium]
MIVPVYNMRWCVERAIVSALNQSLPAAEVIVVDDCSTDDTADVVRHLMRQDARIRLVRTEENVGHLGALRSGLRESKGYWLALLDADDELTRDSLERRVAAARDHESRAGELPGLIYGDFYWEKILPGTICHFHRIEGRDFSFLARELSLCPTSTIMLTRAALRYFPEVSNPYNTDDEIVLSIARHLPIMHAGCPVAVTHDHEGETRMRNSARRRFRGVAQLVWDHRLDVLQHHGSSMLFLWCLRVFRVFLEWQLELVALHTTSHESVSRRLQRNALNWYQRRLTRAHARLTAVLKNKFAQLYF